MYIYIYTCVCKYTYIIIYIYITVHAHFHITYISGKAHSITEVVSSLFGGSTSPPSIAGFVQHRHTNCQVNNVLIS